MKLYTLVNTLRKYDKHSEVTIDTESNAIVIKEPNIKEPNIKPTIIIKGISNIRDLKKHIKNEEKQIVRN